MRKPKDNKDITKVLLKVVAGVVVLTLGFVLVYSATNGDSQQLICRNESSNALQLAQKDKCAAGWVEVPYENDGKDASLNSSSVTQPQDGSSIVTDLIGAKVISGDGSPIGGVDGDYFFSVPNRLLFGPKKNGQWPNEGLFLGSK
jgi:hypothetical protein